MNDEEERPDQQSADFDILYKARQDIPGCELSVDVALIGFKGGFF